MNGKEFKALRKMLNFTQIDLANKLGLDRTSIGNYEKDPTAQVPPSKAKALQLLVDEAKKHSSISTAYLEKEGVRVELLELVDHFVKNKDKYYAESEYLKLYIESVSEKMLIEKLLKAGVKK